MKKVILLVAYILVPLVFILIGWFGNTAYNLYTSQHTPFSKETPKPTPLAKYTIENLSKAQIKPAKIELGKMLKDDPKFTSYEFSMEFSPDFSTNTKKTSGLINIPKTDKKPGSFPVVVMFRGYVDPTKYVTGVGTRSAGEFFAKNGFITIAPDFLGYGSSDKESTDIFETRFQTYVTAITLLKSIETLKTISLTVGTNGVKVDANNIFIRGHSNGGQIALTTLETTGVNYPTVLWAPVSKPFPYSILYYTDDASDSGKFLRQKTSDFENVYDSDLFSLTKHLDKIKAPIQLNQGTNDDAVPFYWSDQLSKTFLDLNLDLNYIKYPGADHNMNPSWNNVVDNNLQFFKKHLK